MIGENVNRLHATQINFPLVPSKSQTMLDLENVLTAACVALANMLVRADGLCKSEREGGPDC